MLEVIVLGLVLSADSFSAALAMGSRRFTVKDVLRFAFLSAGAEGISTLVGFYAGSRFIAVISDYDHWIAFGLLLGVSLHMAYEGFQGLRSEQKEVVSESFHGFFKILLVSFATSLDAFGVGIGLGVANKEIGIFIVSIFSWAFVSTIVGLYLGQTFSKKLGPIFTLVAAVILGALAVQMLKI